LLGVLRKNTKNPPLPNFFHTKILKIPPSKITGYTAATSGIVVHRLPTSQSFYRRREELMFFGIFSILFWVILCRHNHKIFFGGEWGAGGFLSYHCLFYQFQLNMLNPTDK